MNAGTNGLEVVTHTIDDTLQVDNKFATEYRYRGGNSVVNNWVYFNCKDETTEQNDANCEKWRIIGIIPTEDIDKNINYRFKIIKSKSSSNMYWYSGANADNRWSYASLNEYLNETYDDTLNTNAKYMISSTKYYLGGFAGSYINQDTMWQYERKKSGSDYYYGTNPTFQNELTKKIALMYASDYGYGASKECSKDLDEYSSDNLCIKTNNWLHSGSVEWLINQGSSSSIYAFYVGKDGNVSFETVNKGWYYSHPVLTISSDVQITSGKGTNSEPYQFRLQSAPIDATTFAKRIVGTNGLELVTHTIDNTLQVDNKFATEYRYRGGGSVVKNYVTFNNETWRIIGVIPTEDTSGNVENRFKIIRDKSIGNMKWNTIQDTTTNSYNNWITGTLNTYLNNDYYNTLTSDAKNMIGTTKYYLGGFAGSYINQDTMWQYERKNDANRSGYYYGTNPIMQNDANKKIAIMYASDYGYGASKKCTSNLDSYDGYTNCITTNNWLDKSQHTWLLPHRSGFSDNAFHVYSSGSVQYNDNVSDNEFAVLPVLYLSSNVKISGGEGTSSNPYTLSQ